MPEMPLNASKMFAAADLAGWQIKVKETKGEFHWGVKVYYTSLALVFKKKGQRPIAGLWLNGQWDTGMAPGIPSYVISTQKSVLAYLKGDLDLVAELERLNEKKRAKDEESSTEDVKYVQVYYSGKKATKMPESQWLEFVKNQKIRRKPDWVK